MAANRMLNRVMPRSNSTGGLPISPSPSDSPGNLSLNIVVKQDYVFLAGSHVDGYLEVDVQDAQLYLGDLGIELTGIEELRSKDHTSTKRLLVTRIDFQSEDLPPSNAVKPGAALPGGFYLAYKGKTRFPFSFDLPAGLPSSCAMGNTAAIKYDLRAIANISVEGVVGVRSEKLPIKIAERWTDWRNGPWSAGTEKHTSMAMKHAAEGTVDLMVDLGKAEGTSRLFWTSLEPSTHHGNELIKAKIRVRNNSKRDVSGIKVSLVRKLRGVSKQVPSTLLVSQTVHTQDHHGAGFLFTAGKETHAEIECNLPPEECWTARKGTLFELDCFLRVQVPSNHLSSDLLIEVPIWIAQPRSLPKAAHPLRAEATLALPTAAPFPISRSPSMTSDTSYVNPYHQTSRPPSAMNLHEMSAIPQHLMQVRRSETMPAVYSHMMPVSASTSSIPVLSRDVPFMQPLPSMMPDSSSFSNLAQHFEQPQRGRSPLPMPPAPPAMPRSHTFASLPSAPVPPMNQHRSRSPLPQPPPSTSSWAAPPMPSSPHRFSPRATSPVEPYSAIKRAHQMVGNQEQGQDRSRVIESSPPPPPVPPRPIVRQEVLQTPKKMSSSSTVVAESVNLPTPDQLPVSVKANSPGRNSVSDLEDMVDNDDNKDPVAPKQARVADEPVYREPTPLEQRLASPLVSTEVSFPARRAAARTAAATAGQSPALPTPDSPVQRVASPARSTFGTEVSVSALRAKSMSRAQSVRDLNERLVHEDPRDAVRRALGSDKPVVTNVPSPLRRPLPPLEKEDKVEEIKTVQSEAVNRITHWLADTSLTSSPTATSFGPASAAAPATVEPESTSRTTPRRSKNKNDLRLDVPPPTTPTSSSLVAPKSKTPSPSSPTRSMRSPAPKTSPAASPAHATSSMPKTSPGRARPARNALPQPSPTRIATATPMSVPQVADSAVETKSTTPSRSATYSPSKWSDMLRQEESFLRNRTVETENQPRTMAPASEPRLVQKVVRSELPDPPSVRPSLFAQQQTQPRRVSNSLTNKRWSAPAPARAATTTVEPFLNTASGKRAVLSSNTNAYQRLGAEGIPPPRSQTTVGIAKLIERYQASLAQLN